jgi:hypothetical protein
MDSMVAARCRRQVALALEVVQVRLKHLVVRPSRWWGTGEETALAQILDERANRALGPDPAAPKAATTTTPRQMLLDEPLCMAVLHVLAGLDPPPSKTLVEMRCLPNPAA